MAEMFQKADINKDEVMDLKEFQTGVMDHPVTSKIFQKKKIDANSRTLRAKDRRINQMLREISTLKQNIQDLKSQLARTQTADKKRSDCEERSYLDWFCKTPGLMHISEQVLSLLDRKSLANCRQVSKTCKNFIDNSRLLLKIQVIQMKKTKSFRKEQLDSYGMWRKSLNLQGTICEMFPVWSPAFDYAENTMNVCDLQVFTKILRSLLIKVDADNFDSDPLGYTLNHYRKSEEFQFLVKTQVAFNEDRESSITHHNIINEETFYLSLCCKSILPKRLESLVENWTKRSVPLVFRSYFTEKCIKNGFGNEHSPYEVLKILIRNAKKIGINPNPKLGNDAKELFRNARILHGVNTDNYDPTSCKDWSFLHFVLNFKLYDIVKLYQNLK